MIANFFKTIFEYLVAWGNVIHEYRLSRGSRTWYY